MTELPTGWRRTDLGSLGLYSNGRGFKKSEWRDNGRPIIRIQNLTGSSEAFNHFDGDADERYIARSGDLLMSWAATLGAYIWNGPEAVVNQHIFKVDSNIDKKFHKYLLDFKLEELMRQTHGSGMVHITRGKFESLPVSVPQSLDEQRRIVDILEDHLSRLDAAQTNLALARSRSEGLLVSALLGDVYVQAAPIASLASLLAESLTNGRSVPTREGGFPVLRMTALKDDGVDLAERKGGAWTESDAKPFLVRRGDFLVSRGNGSLRLVGRGAHVIKDPDLVAYPDTLIRIRTRCEVMVPEYLHLVWNSPIVRRQIESMARTTAGIYKVNQKHLESVRIPVPGMEQQMAVSKQVGHISAAANRLQDELRSATQRGERLRLALLGAAFSGRLTGRSTDMEMTEEMAGV